MDALNFTGFETGDLSEVYATVGTALSISSSIVNPAPGATPGIYSLRVNPSGSNTAAAAISGIAVDGTSGFFFSATTVYVRFYYYVAVSGGPASGEEEVSAIFDSVGNVKLRVTLNSSGLLSLYDSLNTFLGSTSGAISYGTWHLVEIKCSTGSPSAAAELKVDGVSVISTTGDLGTNDSSVVWLGKRINTNSNSVDFYYDDLLIHNSDWPGPGYCIRLPPVAAGNYQSWIIGAGSGSNYQQISEVPYDGDTTYLSSNGSSSNVETDVVESWTTARGGATSDAIHSIKGIWIVKRDGGSNASVKRRIRFGGTNYDVGIQASIGSTYTPLFYVMNANLATSADWVPADLSAIEVGAFTFTSTSARLTMDCLTVDYYPGALPPVWAPLWWVM